MAKVLRKLETGEEVKSFELETKLFADVDYEGKALKDNEIEIVGSTSASDRDGEVIEPKGINLKAYKKNPIILPQHNYGRPAIGKATKVRVVDNKLVFKIQFPEDGVNPEADVYRKLYKSGFMTASSIGFIPTKWVDGDGKKTPWRTFTKSELLELSLVSVPANSEALVTARGFVEKGVISEQELEIISKDALPKVEEIKEEKDISLETGFATTDEVVQRLIKVENDIKILDAFVKGMASKSVTEDVITEEVVEEKSFSSYLKDVLQGGKGEAISTDAQSTECKTISEMLEDELKKGE